jgi:hypothetical protein
MFVFAACRTINWHQQLKSCWSSAATVVAVLLARDRDEVKQLQHPHCCHIGFPFCHIINQQQQHLCHCVY